MRRCTRWTILAAMLVTAACSDAEPQGTTSPTATTQSTASPSSSPEPTKPEARGYALMTRAPDTSVLLVGGFVCPECDPTFSGLGDMWSFDGGWVSLAPEEVPPPGDDFAFDEQSGRAVFADVGGETWSYDPAANLWSLVETEDRPIALHGSKMAYDEDSDRMIVFGGDTFSAGSMTDETWAFDLDSARWEQMQPKTSPPIRTYYAMAYDADSDRVILFGGSGPSIGEPFADTWAYDYDHDTWEQMKPKHAPPARTYSVAAYDPGSDRVILYGGSVDEDVAVFQDTWAYDYDHDSWTRLSSKAPMGELAWHAMASNGSNVVLFGGGATRDDYVAGTWLLDTNSATWSPS